MATGVRRLLAAACFVACCTAPLAIVRLGFTYGYDRLACDADFSEWPLYAIDSLFWADLCLTATLIWLVRGWWRWVVALVAVPLLGVTAVLAVFNGLWVSGTYF